MDRNTFIAAISIFLVIVVIGLWLVPSSEEPATPEKEPMDTVFGEANDTDISKKSIQEEVDFEKLVNASAATGIVFTPDGRMIWSELNTGFLKSYRNGTVTTFAEVPSEFIPAVEKGEAGLLSMTRDSEYEEHPYIYVYYASNGTNKVGRFYDSGGKGTNFTIIFDGIPQAKIHNGGDLEFGPDNKLYLSTGDATPIEMTGEGYYYQDRGESNEGLVKPKDLEGNLHNAQNISSKAGKILRMNRDGSLPEDNPYNDTYTFAQGLRNVFGMEFHPVSGDLYAGDQGVECCDEINIVEEGENYGWPLYNGFVDENGYRDPMFAWNSEERISPTGMDFHPDVKGSEISEKELFLGAWKTRDVYRFEMNGEGGIKEFSIYSVPRFGHENMTDKEKEKHRSHGHVFGGILDVATGPGGDVYVSDLGSIYRFSP